jgi:hypothetical protein
MMSVACLASYYFVQIIANWEQSGNGFGQRAVTDENYGHFRMHTVNGDNRASFINDKVGHRVHHLYLWFLADKMGILSNVLNILSAEAGADGDNVHTDTQRVQRKRKSDTEDKHDKREKRVFRESVGNSLALLAVTSKEDSMRKEEDKVERLQLALFDAEAAEDNRKVAYYTQLLEFSRKRINEYLEDLEEMKKRVYGDKKKDKE